jgi:hypothetical protein
MATINVSDSTKKRFKQIKLKNSAKRGYYISEDEFVDNLLDKMEKKK